MAHDLVLNVHQAETCQAHLCSGCSRACESVSWALALKCCYCLYSRAASHRLALHGRSALFRLQTACSCIYGLETGLEVLLAMMDLLAAQLLALAPSVLRVSLYLCVVVCITLAQLSVPDCG